MDSFIAYALIGSALDEVVANPSLLKHASTDPDAELLDYLEQNAGELKTEVDRYCNSWLAGCRQKLAEAGLEKTALFGLEQTSPKLNTALEVARLGGYFVPGVGTGIMGAEALGNFKDMLSGGKSWTQRLGSGASGLMNTGLAGLSLIPGAGAIGGLLKVVGRGGGALAKVLGKGGTRLAERTGTQMLNFANKPLQATLSAAESGQGLAGRGLRAAGFGPGYKPWFGWQSPHSALKGLSSYVSGMAARTPEEAVRFAQQVRQLKKAPGQLKKLRGQAEAAQAAGQATRAQALTGRAARVEGAVKKREAAGFAHMTRGISPIMASMPAGRRALAILPAQMVASSVAAGPGRISQPAPWDNFGSRERWWATHPGRTPTPQYEQALLKAMNN